MKKNSFLTLFLLLVLSAGAVFVLFTFTKPDHSKGNGFRRTFGAIRTLAGSGTLDIKFDSYYIAGKAGQTLYLGNLVAPRHLLAINVATLDTQHIQLRLPAREGVAFWAVKANVDSPEVYLTDGTVPVIFHGTLREREARRMTQKAVYFLDLEPIGRHSFAIRALNSLNDARLGKLVINPVRPDRAEFPPGLLKKQVDGIFCTEGMLLSDPVRKHLVYLYHYRNEYLVMDTTLRLLSTWHTVDTTTRAKVKIATVESTNARTFSAPPPVVNRQADASGSFLFVNSALAADNEPYEEFRRVSVIDVYDLNDGHYVRSFYVPPHDDKKFRHFRVMGNRLLAQYERSVVVYPLALLPRPGASQRSLHVKPGRKTEHL
jgi:hypothetical protein